MNLSLGYNNLWSTPIFYDKIDQRDYSNLLNYVLSSERDDLNLEEWVGNKSFDHLVLKQKFSAYLDQCFDVKMNKYTSWKFKKWINGTYNNSGYAMQPHNHMGAKISGVLYLVAEGEETGTLTFLDPRTNANRGYDDNFKAHFDFVNHKPSSGDLIIFPSFLWHYVYPTISSMRIVMPIDLYLD